MKQLTHWFDKGYCLLITNANWLQPILLLIFRVTFGYQLFINGKGKLINHPDIVDYFKDLHIPFPELNAWFVGGLECVGGLLLVVGLASRPIGLLLCGNMTVAYLSVESDRQKVFNIFKDVDAFLQAAPFFYLLTAALVLAFGPGMFSIDYLLGKFVFRKNSNDDKPAENPQAITKTSDIS